jgi:hypothetical protein
VAGDVRVGLRYTYDDEGRVTGSEVYFTVGAGVNVNQVNMSVSTPALTWQAQSEAPNGTYWPAGTELVFAAPKSADVSQGIQVQGDLLMDRASYQALTAANAVHVERA